MRIIKIYFSLMLLCGIPVATSSVLLFNSEHNIWLAVVGIICAFIGTGLVFGFEGFKKQPKHIGNIDDNTMPVINQNWAVFFISLIINLLVANLCGNF